MNTVLKVTGIITVACTVVVLGCAVLDLKNNGGVITSGDLDTELDELALVRDSFMKVSETTNTSLQILLNEYVDARIVTLTDNSWYRTFHKATYDDRFRTRAKELATFV